MSILGYTGVAFYRIGARVLVQSGGRYEVVSYGDVEDQLSSILEGAEEDNSFLMWYDMEVKDAVL